MIDETKLLIQSCQISKANDLLNLINNYHIRTVPIDTTNKKLKILNDDDNNNIIIMW
jgi:hypothetical protein